MTKRWRSKSHKSLIARPIYAEEFPKLLTAMEEDGLVAEITAKGISWSVAGYSLTATAVREAWSLTDSQYRRLCDYLYVKYSN